VFREQQRWENAALKNR